MESTGTLLACPGNERLLATSLYNLLQSLVKQLPGKIKKCSVEKEKKNQKLFTILTAVLSSSPEAD